MRRLLLTAAGTLVALTIAAAPAAAIDSQQSSAGVTVHRGGPKFVSGDFRDDRRNRRGSDNGIYYGDREYQGDTAWRAQGFNDWWHERPWRSYPRWISTNSSCERKYWAGGEWRC